MEYIPEKLLLCYKTSLKGGMMDNLNDESIKEPINKLINKKNEIDIIVNRKKNNLFKFLYFNWKIIGDILYEEDELIDLNDKKNILKQLSDFFYLDLIIKNNEEIKEFNYSIKLINVINNIQINNKDEEIFKKLICAKIIIDLINNIDSEETDTDILDNIKKSNEDIIENITKNDLQIDNIKFESIDSDFILEKKIDEIYSFILEEIIKNKIFDKHKKIESILEELDIKNIDLTNTVLENLKKIFQNDEFIHNYKISDLEDLINNEEKINFYNALQEYIFKNIFYICQIDFFIDFRKIIISSLKSRPEEIIKSINKHKSKKDKIISMINFYTGSDYFYGKYIEEFEKLEFCKKFNFVLNYENSSNDDFKDKFMELRKINTDKIINFKLKKKFIKYREGLYKLMNKLEKNYSLLKNFDIKYETKINENKFLGLLTLHKKETIIKAFCFKNIWEKGINETQGFLYFIKYLKEKASLELDRENSLISYASSNLSSTSEKKFYVCKFYQYKKIENLLKDKNKYEILNIERIISKHASCAETIMEINNGYMSIDLENNIYIYNKDFIRVNLKNPKEEKREDLKEDLNITYKDIILTFNNGVYLYIFNDKLLEIDRIIKLSSETATAFIKTNKIMILANKKYIKVLESFSQEQAQKEISIASGIKIGINSAAFISNTNLVNGHDEKYFYDDLRNDIVKFDIKEDIYSYSLSKHSLNLMPNERGWKVFLLCGCKNTNEENGILIINLNSYKTIFQEINNFEVHCFCPIFIIKQKNDKMNNYYTNYFFVGGFDTIKKKGGIKLYKLNYEDDNIKKIEFIQDITFEKQKIKKFVIKERNIDDSEEKYTEFEDYIFKGFESNISCITQSTKTGNILISCWDGNVFLSSEPNISIYLKDDKEKRNLR